MGVKLLIFNEEDPDIAITLAYTAPGDEKAQGWHGGCTECGKAVHFWTESGAFKGAQAHVDSHTP